MKLKICGVCGAKALGNNFNAVTCESCKAFFRRNAFKLKAFSCHFSNNCKIDEITRRFCQKCRLRKCFEIGMKKEWIMSERSKNLSAVSLQKIKFEIKNKNHLNYDDKLLGEESDTYNSSSSCSSSESFLSSGHKNIGVIEKRYVSGNGCSSSNKDEKVFDKLGVLEVINSSGARQIFRMSGESFEFREGRILSYLDSKGGKELTPAENHKLAELITASQALNAPVDEECPVKMPKMSSPSLLSLINLTDIAIRRLIKMAKKISGFKNMCQDDQIALLKGGCTEMMILRSVVTYDPDKDSWNIPHSYGCNINLGVLKEARGNLYEEHRKFVSSFKSEWRNDENLMMVLCAILLFSSERPNVVHHDVVNLEQESYYFLLLRYLNSAPGVSEEEAREKYWDLIDRIRDLRNLNSNTLRVFLEVNPTEVQPLLLEIFDLK